MQENLFPKQTSRRQFLQTGAIVTATVAGWGGCRAMHSPRILLRSRLVLVKRLIRSMPVWQIADGQELRVWFAVVVDSQDRVFVTSRSANAPVAIFDKDGKLLEIWEKELSAACGYDNNQIAATAHGLYWSKEGDQEFLYWTENVSAPKDKEKIGARVYKTDLKGKLLYTIGNVKEENGTSQKFDFTNPTDVAVAPNGDIYVVDGYGSQKLHRFDKNFKLIKTIGAKGKEHGQFNTNHGVWVNTLKKEPELYIADRANDRIEVFLAGTGIQAHHPWRTQAMLFLSSARATGDSRVGSSRVDLGCRRQFRREHG